MITEIALVVIALSMIVIAYSVYRFAQNHAAVAVAQNKQTERLIKELDELNDHVWASNHA